MSDELADAIAHIFRSLRHLMTEAERRADRALVLDAKLKQPTDPAAAAELQAAIRQALSDPLAGELFRRGRERFFVEVARRIISQHPEELPRCAQCGEFFKSPSPKRCFTCDFANEPK